MATAALLGSLDGGSAGSTGYALPLFALGAVPLIGQTCSSLAWPLQTIVRSRIDGARRARLAALGVSTHTADAEPLRARLPQGADTQLGKRFGGPELSEGQWQKVAQARARMRPEPLLFVLDEPAASLDAPSEHVIFERYMACSREIATATGAITLIVSHRFSTVAGADLILVMDRERLVEAGTHEELAGRDGGAYAELYGIQATAYAAK